MFVDILNMITNIDNVYRDKFSTQSLTTQVKSSTTVQTPVDRPSCDRWEQVRSSMFRWEDSRSRWWPVATLKLIRSPSKIQMLPRNHSQHISSSGM